MRRALTALVAALAGGALAPAGTYAAVSLAQVGSFTSPVHVTAPPGDLERLFVVEQPGRIQVLRGGRETEFLDISDKVKSGGEQGLLSMAFAPDYAASGLFYVYYTAPPVSARNGSLITIEEYRRATPDLADPTSARVVLRVPHYAQENHNGGQLQMGPDGLLWIATGDGGGAGDPQDNAQDTDPIGDNDSTGHNALLGKLLRVDPRPGAGCGGSCTIPAGNPGFGRPEIWAYGLRNPWRFSFDRQTGDLWIGDVGQNAFEEIDFAPAPARGSGFNWGWDAREGAHPYPGGALASPQMRDPVIEHNHAEGWYSIVGGHVVRDPALPELLGKYVYGDTSRGRIHAATMGSSGAVTANSDTGLSVNTLVSFGEDGCARVHAVSLQGPVYRLSDSGECRPATPGAGSGAGTPAPAGPDTTAPAVSLRAPVRQRVLRTAVARVIASCDEQCDVLVRARFDVRRVRGRTGARAARTLRAVSTRGTLAAGARIPLRLKAGPRTRRSLAGALRRGRRVSIVFSVRATDRAGNRMTRTVRARVIR